MDSVNISEKIESPQKVFKNAAINTESFFACAFCGSRNYLQSFSQTNCFPAFGSDFPGLCEKEYSSHEPVFSSPPLFQPLFQNKFVPPNVFYSHVNVASSINANLANNQIDDKVCRQPSPFFMLYHPSKDNNVGTGGNAEGENDEGVESGAKAGFENRVSCAPVCSCNNVIPWTCSPCMVPMISYFVSWGPAYTARKFVKSNVSGNGDEKPSEGEKNCKILKSSSASTTAIEMEDKCISSQRISEKLKKMEWRTTCEFKESSTSFVSTASLENNDEELSFAERKRAEDKEAKASIHFGADYATARKFPDQLEELDENNATDDETNSIVQPDGDYKGQIYCSDSVDEDKPRDHSTVNSSTSSTVNSDAESCAFETVIPKEENDGDDGDDGDSIEANDETKPDEPLTEKGTIEKCRNVKKLITNFTMSDECKTEPEEESNVCEESRIAAAGDVRLNSELELKVASENQNATSKLNDSNPRENLPEDFNAGERLPTPVKDSDKKDKTKKYQANGRFNDVTTKKKNATPPLNAAQEDGSAKEAKTNNNNNNNNKRKPIYPAKNPTVKTNAELSPRSQDSKTRPILQSKGPKNLRFKVENNLRESLTRRRDPVKNLNLANLNPLLGQNVALEKDAAKSVLRSRK